MSLRLIVETDDRTQRFPLAEGSHRIGSSPGNGVRVSHPSISRRHAILHVDGERAEIEDLGSRNGTRIGGRKLVGRRPLEVGERFTLGAVAAVLEEVPDKDLEPAVSFEAASEPARPDDESTTATAALGTTRFFALKLLPELLARLADRCGAVRMAQAVGAALFESLPCLAVEVRSKDREGVLFSARHDEVSELSMFFHITAQ